MKDETPYERAIRQFNEMPNNMAMREKIHQQVLEAKQQWESGQIDPFDYYELEGFFNEMWVEPITLRTKVGEVILN